MAISAARLWTALRVRLLAAAAVLTICAVSAGIAHAATSSFAGRVPRIGSTTFPTAYVTTPEFRDINVRLLVNPYDTYVKPVRCNGGDISTAKFFPANDHNVRVVASSVLDGTCFRLNFDAPTLNYFDISGRVSY